MTDGEIIIAALEKDAARLMAESNAATNRAAERRRFALLYSGVNRALMIARQTKATQP